MELHEVRIRTAEKCIIYFESCVNFRWLDCYTVQPLFSVS